MSYLGIFVLILAIGTGCGFLIAEDPGYALFSYQNWTVEMPLWLSLALMFFSVIALVGLFWIIYWLQGSSQKIKQWVQNHQHQNARIQTNKGLLALSAGRFQEAERYLSQSAAHSDQALVNYLYAAQAAQLLGAFDRRDHYLERAAKMKEHSPVAVELTQATLNLKAGRLQEEVPRLETLYQENPKNTEVLRVLAETYQKKQDFKSLVHLLPILAKKAVFPSAIFENLEQKTYEALLPMYAQEGLKNLMAFWDKTPKTIHQNPTLIEHYVALLIQEKAFMPAEKCLRQAILAQWNTALVRLYGLFQSTNLKDQQRFITNLLSEHPTDPCLLLTAGRISVYRKELHEAREYFEKSLYLKPMVETYAALGELLEQLEPESNPQEYFKKGLLLAATNQDLPLVIENPL